MNKSNVPLKTEQQFLSYLKAIHIDILNYTYTKDKEKNVYGLPGKAPIKNPYLWNKLTNDKVGNAIDYIINDNPDLLDSQIFIAILEAKDTSIITKKRLDSLIKTLNLTYLKDHIKPINFEIIISTIISNTTGISFGGLDKSKRTTEFVKTIIEFMKEKKIEPRNATYGNIGEGRALTDASKIGNKDLVIYLLENGANVHMDDDWCLSSAIKNGHYDIALLLISHGADITVRNNQGLKLIEMNDRKGLVPVGANKEALREIMNLYSKK